MWYKTLKFPSFLCTIFLIPHCQKNITTLLHVKFKWKHVREWAKCSVSVRSLNNCEITKKWANFFIKKGEFSNRKTKLPYTQYILADWGVKWAFKLMVIDVYIFKSCNSKRGMNVHSISYEIDMSMMTTNVRSSHIIYRFLHLHSLSRVLMFFRPAWISRADFFISILLPHWQIVPHLRIYSGQATLTPD